MTTELQVDVDHVQIVIVDIDEPDDDDRPADSDAHRPSVPDCAQTTGHGPLDDVEREILEFEKLTWKYAGAKESEIRRRWGWSATRYFQVLNALIDRPEAAAHDGQLINRLTRLRDARRRQRTAGER